MAELRAEQTNRGIVVRLDDILFATGGGAIADDPARVRVWVSLEHDGLHLFFDQMPEEHAEQQALSEELSNEPVATAGVVEDENSAAFLAQ